MFCMHSKFEWKWGVVFAVVVACACGGGNLEDRDRGVKSAWKG